MKGFSKKFDGFAATFLALISLAALIFCNISVFARIISKPSPWSDELLRAVFIWVFYLAVPLAFKEDKLVGITLLEEFLGKKANKLAYRVLKTFQALVVLLVAVILAYESLETMVQQFAGNELSPVLQFPQGLTTMGFVLGTVWLAIYVIGRLVHIWKSSDKELMAGNGLSEGEEALEKFGVNEKKSKEEQ